MIEFLTENWKWFAAIFISIVEFVCLFVFRKRSTIVDNSLFKNLSLWIAEAEEVYGAGKGDMKLHYVLEKAKFYFGDLVSVDSVKPYIEWLLALPKKKKEGIDNE